GPARAATTNGLVTTTRGSERTHVAGGVLQVSGKFGSAPVLVQAGKGDKTAPAPPSGLPVSARALHDARMGKAAYYLSVAVRGTHLRMYVPPSRDASAIIVARSLSEVDSALNRLAWGLGITCLVGIVIAALVGAVVARGALRPVRRLTDT